MNIRHYGKQIPKVLVLSCCLAVTPTMILNAGTPNTTITNQDRQIEGVVKDNTGETVIGASVLVKGTTTGVTTDLDGRFVLNVPKGATLQISYMGYKTQEIVIEDQTTLDIVLESDVEALDEVVVTALGIKREKKSLGYAMQELKTEGMTEIRSESAANLLQGKVAGVQISQSGTGMGGSTRIVLRGTTSLSGNNQPLWVVDGMPINDGQGATVSGEWGGDGIDFGGAASMINPDDIESISVLKGANAAALYGSRAQNGAIIVTTKKGKSGELQIEYNGNLTFSQPYDSYEYQNVYSQGSGGSFAIGATGSWGAKMEGQLVNSWRGVNAQSIYNDSRYDSQYALLPQNSYIEDFYQTGLNYTNTITASGGSDHATARFSFSDQRNEGITPNHTLNKQYYDLASELKSKYIDLSVKINYMRQKGEGRPTMGEYGVTKTLITMPRGIRLSDLQDPIGLDGNTVNWIGRSREYTNPYTKTLRENTNNDETNRIIGSLQLVGKITDWLKVTGRVGIDWYNMKRVTKDVYAQDIQDTQYTQVKSNTEEFNADLMLNFNKRFGDFDITANVGAAMTAYKYDAMSGSSGYYSIPAFPTLGNGNNQVVSEDFSKKRINSVLGNASIGWKSMLYLDFSARNDWSSTLPADNRSYFYPSVSLSGIISEMVDLPEQISYLKARVSYAQVGNDTDPYRLMNYYYFETIGGSIVTTSPNDPSVNYGILSLRNLKPEDTRSYEAGIEYRMFGNRLGLDVTYYHANTYDQILNVSVAGSSGYERQLINAGKMRSYGTEISLTGTPIETKDWTWDVTLNWGLNRTDCAELDEDLKRFVVGQTRLASVVVDEGGRYGDIVATKYYERDENGNVVIDPATGLPVINSGEKVIGNMTPDWTGSFATTLRWKNLSLSALIDARVGGDIISMTDAYAAYHGTSARTLEGREGGFVVPGVLQGTGETNTIAVDPQNYWAAVGGGTGVAEEFMYDASYVKFRELSLGYTFPHSWLKNLPISNVKLSFVGRDLFYIFKGCPSNPEGSFGRQDYAQAFEFMALPSTRSFGFNLNVKF